MTYKYIEIRENVTKKIIQRNDVSNNSDRSIQRIESGMNINLNHDKYHTESFSSNIELKPLPEEENQEDVFREFIRTYHLTSMWETFIKTRK